MKPYRPSWAYEDVVAVDVGAQLGMTRDQRMRAAAVVYVWARVAAAAGLGSDLSNWPAGDPVSLVCRNILDRDAQRPTPPGLDLPPVLYGAIAEWQADGLPSPRQAEAIEHRIQHELTSTSGEDGQVA